MFNAVRHQIIQLHPKGEPDERVNVSSPSPSLPSRSVSSPTASSLLIFLGPPCSALVSQIFPPFPSLISVLGVQVGLRGPKLCYSSVLESPAEREICLASL